MNKLPKELLEILEKAQESSCSDGGCIFKFKKTYGMHTNGGCKCLDGLGYEKRSAVRRILLYLKYNNGLSDEKR